MFEKRIGERLAQLIERSGTSTSRGGRRREPIPFDELLPGGEVDGPFGSIFLHEKFFAEVDGDERSLIEGLSRSLAAGNGTSLDESFGELGKLRASGLGSALFLDLETTGLSNCPVFLAGTMHLGEKGFIMRQFFARHYGEEKALLFSLGEFLKGFSLVVTFNGKAFDMPLLKDRALVHGLSQRFDHVNLDILHVSRKMWGGTTPDCKLKTLEWLITRKRRIGDVPSEEIPGIYHRYVKNGSPYSLLPIFHHNLLDLATMARLLARALD
ncbi:MAG: ribonuclease H-like domain-containing protein [Candidatus Eisenbacteria bacterium]|nr:ribonuclease H-like domain-containing protein [Candidatus Eisenbacteria bacterium]